MLYYSTDPRIVTTYSRMQVAKQKAAKISSLKKEIESLFLGKGTEWETLREALYLLSSAGAEGTVIETVTFQPADYWAFERIWLNGAELHSVQGLKEVAGVRYSKDEHFSSQDTEIRELKKLLFALKAVLSAYGK
jgi:hypothetical protein